MQTRRPPPTTTRPPPPEWGPSEASPDEPEPEHREQVEEDRREVDRPELVPLVRPAEDLVAGDVGEIRDGAVRVAERVRGLALAVLLDPIAHLAGAVGRAAFRTRVLDREVPVRALPVDDPVGTDHARVADVDDVRGAPVQAD